LLKKSIHAENDDVIAMRFFEKNLTGLRFAPWVYVGLLRFIRELALDRDFKIGFSRAFGKDRNPTFTAYF
jgi:hypothetical protein